MNDIEVIQSKAVTSVLSKSLVAVTPALATYRTIKHEAQAEQWNHPHDARFAAQAVSVRNKRLPRMLEVDAAVQVLARACNLFGVGQRLERQTAAVIVGKIYRSLGVKSDSDLLDGVLDMLLEGDELGRASGQWQPIGATLEVLAIAARKIIQSAIYPPKPAEIAQACREARHTLHISHWWCKSWLDGVVATDAILLEFAHHEWEKPYAMPQCRLALARMLTLHSYSCGDDDDEASPFQVLLATVAGR